MAAMRWQDSNPDEHLENALNDLIKDITKRYGESASTGVKVPEPAVSVGETEEYYVIVAEIPGILTRDIKITAAPAALILEGRWQGPGFDENTALIHDEIHTGFFKRVIDLPGPVKGELARAQLENGLLEIALPKSETRRPDNVDIPL